MAAITVEQFNDIIRHDLPWAYKIGMHADAIGEGTATLRLPFDASMLRPVGSSPGPR